MANNSQTISVDSLMKALGVNNNGSKYNYLRQRADYEAAGDAKEAERLYQIMKKQADEVGKKLEYEKASLSVKKQMVEEEAKSLKASRDNLDLQIRTLENKKQASTSQSEIEELEAEISRIREKTLKLDESHANKLRDAAKMEKELNRAYSENVSFLEKKAAFQEKINNQKKEEKKLQDEANQRLAAARFNIGADIEKAEAEGDDARVASLKAQLSAAESAIKSELREKIEESRRESGLNRLGELSFKDSIVAGLSEAVSSGSLKQGLSTTISSSLGPIVQVLDVIAKFASGINKTLDKGITDALSVQSSYLGKVNARLQGSSETFQGIQAELNKVISGSPFVSHKKVMENIADLVNRGISYNVEERGILMTLSERMVTTFEALNPTLLRLNKLQQSDLTASQLGYEALLTEFFNSQFQDTSYLSDVYDSITSTILDATSQLDATAAGAFNFAVQKWLGSLYAVGMSEQGVSTIAQGLNYLATGNVSAFNSNEGMRNLFAGAAGSSLSGILTGGLNAETVDSLMMSIVEYLKEIAGDTNTVTRQARAGIFGGFSLSDIRSVTNLNAAQLSSIQNYVANYEDASEEVYNQLVHATTTYDINKGTDSRVSLSQLFDTMIDNVLYEFGNSYMTDINTYSKWKLKSMVAESGIPIISSLADISKLVDLTGGFEANNAASWVADAIIGLFNRDNDSEKSPYRKLVESIRSMADIITGEGYFDGKQTAMIGRLANLYAESPIIRGNADDYVSIAASNTYTGMSMSERLGLADNGFADLAGTAAATSAKTTYAGGETSRNVTDLYAELFERQTTAIKVSLSGIDASAANTLNMLMQNNSNSTVNITNMSEPVLTALREYLGGAAVEAISDKLDGTIKVDNADNFIYTLDYGLAQSRGL